VNKCSRSSMMIQKEMQKEINTKVERRTQCSTSRKNSSTELTVGVRH
jgi:hypothetical protein